MANVFERKGGGKGAKHIPLWGWAKAKAKAKWWAKENEEQRANRHIEDCKEPYVRLVNKWKGEKGQR